MQQSELHSIAVNAEAYREVQKTIETLQTVMETYRIRCLAIDYHSVPNQLYAEAMKGLP